MASTTGVEEGEADVEFEESVLVGRVDAVEVAIAGAPSPSTPTPPRGPKVGSCYRQMSRDITLKRGRIFTLGIDVRLLAPI